MTAVLDDPLRRGTLAPPPRTLVDIFRETVAQAADEPAVDAGTGVLTYAELAEAAEELATELNAHGIGRGFHEEPQVLHYGRKGSGLKLQPGMIFTVEPMITLGAPAWDMWDDGWTVLTKDGSTAAQWEHTLVVTDDGAEILTSPSS